MTGLLQKTWSHFRHIDWIVIGTVAILCIVGLLMVYSSSFDFAYRELDQQPTYFLGRQIIWALLGTAAMIVTMIMDYHAWRRLSIPLMAGALFLLILLLIAGQERFGSVRYLFGGAVQPTELCKLIIIIYAADWFSSRGEKIRTVTYGFIPFAILIGVVAGLIVMQPDFTSAVLIVVTATGMFFVAGGDILQLAIGSIFAGGTFAFLVLRSPHALFRIEDYIDSFWGTPGSYHVQQSVAAIASGGLSGVGLGNGYYKLGILPLAHNDSIFAVLSEELGWVGSLAVIVMFALLFYRGFRIAVSASDSFGALLAFGISSSLIAQTIINIGTMTGAIPPAGIALPFISYGGSSLTTSLTSIGLLVSISRGATREGGDSFFGLLKGESFLMRFMHGVLGGPRLLAIATLVLVGSVIYGGLSQGFFQLPTPPQEIPNVAPRALEGALLTGRVTVLALILFLVALTARLRLLSDQLRLFPRWREVIERQLNAEGRISHQAFGRSGVDLLGLFLNDYEYLDLVLNDSGCLSYRRLQLKQDSDKLWRRIDQVTYKQTQLPHELASNLIGILHSALDMPYQSHVVESRSIFHETLVDTSLLFSSLRIPELIPTFIPQNATLTERDWRLIPQLSRDVYPASQGIALLLAWSADHSRSPVIDRLRQVYAFDIVVLDKMEMQELVVARHRHRLFRQAMLKAISLITVSPFVTTGSTPEEMFFGRENELREIVERASTNNYAVIGGRRIGKTSLLGRLRRIRLPAAGFRTLYHDCSTTPTCDTFLAGIARDWGPEPPPDTPTTFGGLFRSPPTDKPLVLLLDEADKLVPADRADGWRLFNALRALVNSGHAHIVLSGERILRSALQDATSPLFNFANEMILGPLDYRAVEELVTRPMKQLEIELVGEKAIVDRIWAFTSGHPNIVQRLCSRLIERLNEQGTRRITLEDVDAIIENPKFQESDFLQTYWEAATPLEKIITLVLSQEPTTHSLKEVRLLLSKQAHIQPSATATKDALDRLVDLRSILKRSLAGYAFAVEAFHRVLANTTTIEDLLQVLVEQYEQTEAQA